MKPKKVLVVDDESSILEIWSEVFEGAGLTVHTANNGDNAVSLIKEYEFDLILTDMKMPGSDGLVVLQHLEQQQRNVKVIVSTGFVELDDLVENFKIDKIIQKPFDIKRELEEIMNLLNHD